MGALDGFLMVEPLPAVPTLDSGPDHVHLGYATEAPASMGT